MIYYLEGPDGAGKTTLGNNLTKAPFVQLWWRAHHSPPPKDVPAWNYYGIPLWAQQERRTPPVNLIMDRAWLSHHVYEPLFGRPDQLEKTYHALEYWAMAIDRVVMILCLPPFHVCRENWLKRAEEGKELITKAQEDLFIRAYAGFEERPVRTNLPVIHYDYTQDGEIPDQLLHLLGIK